MPQKSLSVLKRARQTEKRRQRNASVRSLVRTNVKNVRYAVQSYATLGQKKSLHQQEVDKHLRSIEAKGPVYRHLASQLRKRKRGEANAALMEKVLELTGQLQKSYSVEKHKEFLRTLARADLLRATIALSKAGSKGIYHKNTVSRQISRLNGLVNSLDRM